MAFQPIIDWSSQEIVGYEALVRGPEGQGAGWVFEQINDNINTTLTRLAV